MSTRTERTAAGRVSAVWLSTAIGGVLLVILGAVVSRLGASAFGVFAIPFLAGALILSVSMAIYWREWRALPLSLVFALMLARLAMDIALVGTRGPRSHLLEWLSELVLWFSVPLSLAAIAGLWRIFENQSRYKQAQDELLENERRYHHLVENTLDAFYTADAAGRFTLVNAAAARLFERRANELIGVSFFDVVPEAVGKDVRQALETQRAKRLRSSQHEFAIPRRDGTARWVAHTVQVTTDAHGVSGFQAVMRDVTERRQVQVALEQSERRLRTLVETMSEGLIQIRKDGRIAFANAAAERILGVARADLEQRHYADPSWEFVRPDGSAMPIEEWAGSKAIKGKKAVANAITGIRRLDGSIAWINANAVPASDDEGVVVTFSDISASKQAAENLRIIEFGLDSAMEHVLLATREGRIIYANKRALQALGYTAAEITALRIFDIDPGLSEGDWTETWQHAKTGEWPTFESRHVTKQGKSFPTLTSASYFEFGNQAYLFAFVRDISREHELAAQLRQAQKMEAIGTLAGGIAHDFNNILSAVLGFTELAMQEVEENSRIRSFLDEIHKGSHRAAGLVKQILTFSRKGEQKPQPLLLAPALKEALKFMRGSLPSTIQIRESIDTNCGPVMADPGQVHQVFVNLCTNAFHAMRANGGTLSVTLKETELGADKTAAHLNLPPGRYAHLSVTDTGHGMDEQTRLRIFEPFFTTKPAGEGTGLGLATVHGIVKSHKGAIHVESRVGKGSAFEVYLPLCGVAARAPAATAAAGPVPRGTETLLLVDDEDPIVRSTALFLERLGYTVATAEDGVQALAMYEKNPDRYALVITDHTMPAMTGFELSRRLLRLSPALPIILCTGFNETVNVDDTRGVGIRELIPKPVEFAQLARHVRTLIDEGRPSRAAR